MTDTDIIDMYFARDQRAVEETQKRYGGYCYSIAQRMLDNKEDSEECVNDAYLKLWETIPSMTPKNLGAYLGRIVRNLSLNRLRHKKEMKRDCSVMVRLSELEDCIPSTDDMERVIDKKHLNELIVRWLSGEEKLNRQIFIRRYWYGSTYEELEQHYGMSKKKLMDRVYHLRKRLKTYLEQEGVSI